MAIAKVAAAILCAGWFVAATNIHADVKTVATNLRGFGVPFRIDANDDSYIEVQLYLSRDEGKTWQFHSRQSTDQEEFPFFADADGTYWFALKTLNRDRRLVPEGDAEPELKIVVDTVKPKLDFQIETDAAGRIACRWKATDNHLNPESLRILYQPRLAAQIDPAAWREVDVKLAAAQEPRSGIYADQIAWWPETEVRELAIRIEVADSAGNVVHEDRQAVVPLVAWKKRSSSTARPNFHSVSQNPLANSPKAESGQASSGHPPGVVCENGVCRIVTPTEPSNTELYGTGIARKIFKPAAQKARTAAAARATNGPPAVNRMATTSAQAPSQPAGSQASPQPTPQRSASRKMAYGLIGSPAEQAAPPRPAGYVEPPAPKQQLRVAQRPAARRPGETVSWPSDKYQWAPRNQSTFSTTLGPDPTLAPAAKPLRPLNQRALANVQPNPQIQLNQGRQNLVQSSTRFPSNQYQGLANSAQANSATTNPPQLLPRQSVAADAARPNQRLTFQPRNQQPNGSDATNSLGPLQNYSSDRPTGNQKIYQQSAYGSSASRGLPPVTQPVRNREQVNRAAIQMISTKRFRLDYAIDAIDPSGVAKVDLWMTRDNGRQWTLWGSDPDNASPFPVQLQDEGRYGFRIVIHSRDGLTGQGPSRGDPPDMFVHIDSQPPLTKITSVPYGRGSEAGKLVINYSISDPFLTLRPINLAYSRGPQGPWTSIEKGLRNTGRYVWKVDTNVPERIFLRIEATDQAGNVGVHQPSQAIDVSGLVPRGTIRGVTPVSTRN